MRKRILIVIIGMSTLTMAASAFAAEHGIGKPLVIEGMILRPVYLQSVEMAPGMPGMDMHTDIHLELDIHADKGNPQGFTPGSWIPYLSVSYSIFKQDSDWSAYGTLTPMVANDGPHYGTNMNLDGAGQYHVNFTISPPPYQAFYRHTGEATGVAAWWSPMQHSWDFVYVGVGKKGGY